MDFKHFQTLVDNLFSYDDAGLVTRCKTGNIKSVGVSVYW